MNKRAIAAPLICSVAAGFILAGCGGGGSTPEIQTDPEQSTTPIEEPPPATDDPPPTPEEPPETGGPTPIEEPTPPEPTPPDTAQEIIGGILAAADYAIRGPHYWTTNNGDLVLPITEDDITPADMVAHDYHQNLAPPFDETRTLHGIQVGVSSDTIRETDEDTGEDIDTLITRMGGWMTYGFFEAEEKLSGVDGDDTTLFSVSGASAGVSSGERPTSGSATWSGAAVGYDIQTTSLSNFFASVGWTARATIQVDFSAETLDAVFSEFVLHGTGSASRDPIDEMQFLDVGINRNGTFDESGRSYSIEGSFYGPDHEEVGGTFDFAPTGSYANHVVVGAFGAERDN